MSLIFKTLCIIAIIILVNIDIFKFSLKNIKQYDINCHLQKNCFILQNKISRFFKHYLALNKDYLKEKILVFIWKTFFLILKDYLHILEQYKK